MHDLQSRMQSDYIEYMRQSTKWNERHNEEYKNLCSEIALPAHSTMETYILRTSVTEEDNTILLSI